MSLTDIAGARPKHFPANPTAFAFDAEVSRIFPDMAQRSIPNFSAAHRAHAEMLKGFLPETPSVLDIGASRGAFFDALCSVYGDNRVHETFDLTAVDVSPDMCEYLRQDYPEAMVLQLDITGSAFAAMERTYDVVCLHYVTQFLPLPTQRQVLRKVFSLVKPGGVLIYGHKASHYGKLGAAAHEQYIDFRVGNGYSREEIEAKTKALAGTMFPADHEDIIRFVAANFREVQETFRFMMFSAFMAVK